MSAYVDILEDCPPRRAVAKDAPAWAILRFCRPGAPELVVDRRDCPELIPAYGHWRADGTCACGESS